MIKNNLGRKAWRLARWRIWVQLGFLLAWLEPLPLQWHGLCAPVFHCYSCPLATLSCPIGILANYSALHAIPLLAVGTLLVVGAIFGSLVCGWACPFGLLQDLLGRIPLPKFRLPGIPGMDALCRPLGAGAAAALLLRRGALVFRLPALPGRGPGGIGPL